DDVGGVGGGEGWGEGEERGKKKGERAPRGGGAAPLTGALRGAPPRHGYEIGQLIARRSDGAINFHVTSLYPTLYRLEDRSLIEGRWVERAGQRRRRYYKLTPAARKTLVRQPGVCAPLFPALNPLPLFPATP